MKRAPPWRSKRLLNLTFQVFECKFFRSVLISFILFLEGSGEIKGYLKSENPEKKDIKTKRSSTLLYWSLAISFVLGATVIAILIGSK